MPSARATLSRFSTRIIAGLALVVGVMLGSTLRLQSKLFNHQLRGGKLSRLGRSVEDDGHGESWPDETPVWIGSEGKITPMIHQIWDDPDVESSCQISVQSWEWFCDVYGCKHKLWRRQDLENLNPFINRDHYDTTESPQMRADIARLEILNDLGGLYLDCDMIWAGRSHASDEFVHLMSTSELAVASSNDIRNATGRDKSLDLAIVFFTNRVLASAPRQKVIRRTIELAKNRLDDYTQKRRRSREQVHNGTNQGMGPSMGVPVLRAFHMTGPYILNLALQEAGESTPVAVIPTNWVYPEHLLDAEKLVMFGHQKDRSVHANGISSVDTEWNSKPWLMQRSLPNFFTKAQDVDSRVSPDEYRIIPTHNFSNPRGAIAVFLHHNKAGGTAVKVAMAQMFNMTTDLTRADSFSKSACAYSKKAVKRTLARQPIDPGFCDHPDWQSRNLPACGRCRSPALQHLYTKDLMPPVDLEHEVKDIAPPALTGEKAVQKCQELKRQNKCKIPIVRGKCCKTCGRLSCPNASISELQETTPTGVSGEEANIKCANFKKQGLCTDPRLRGFCCLTCGAESCSAPNMMVGDYSMGLCDVMPGNRPCAYYTMLREPRKRIASSYLHCQYEPDDQLCMSHVLDARDASFEQWVAHQGNYLFRQLTFNLQYALSIEEQYELYLTYAKHQERMEKISLNGAWMNKQEKFDPISVTEDDITKVLKFKPNMLWLLEQQRGFQLTDQDALSVIELLEYHFAVIGLVERFDESLEMYEAVFGLPFPDAISHRSQQQAEHQLHMHEGEDLTRRKQLQASLVAEFDVNPKLDQYIAVDLALYQRAKDLFEEQHLVLEAMKRDAMGPEAEFKFTEDERPRSWLQSIADETITLIRRTGELVMNDNFVSESLEQEWAPPDGKSIGETEEAQKQDTVGSDTPFQDEESAPAQSVEVHQLSSEKKLHSQDTSSLQDHAETQEEPATNGDSEGETDTVIDEEELAARLEESALRQGTIGRRRQKQRE